MLVYLITNKKNGKKYVGQHAGKDLESYWRRNVWLAETGYQGKRLLYRAIRKYGADGFEVEPLVIVGTKQEMDYYEIGLIKVWDTTNPEKGYNITHGGDGSLGVKMSKETRAKMSESRTGLIMPESHRRKLSERNKGNKYALGRKMTKENHEKLLATHVGAKRSDEARERMRQAQLGKKQSEETKVKREPSLLRGRHTRWHVNRNIVNLKCLLCREGSNSNVIPQ
jgi:group I intron endonuclease